MWFQYNLYPEPWQLSRKMTLNHVNQETHDQAALMKCRKLQNKKKKLQPLWQMV